MRARLTLAASTAALALAGSVFAATPAMAGTGVTFTISAGLLTISEPSAQAGLGTVTATPLGTTTSGSLGTTTINDARGSLAGWTVSVSSTDFTTASPVQTIPASNAVMYLPSLATVTQGVAVVTNTHVAAASGLTLGNSSSSFMTAATTGSNVVTYSPTVQVTLPSTAIAGTYTGTVTQTVA